MIANISKGDKSVSLHLPVRKFQLASVFSYLGIEHMNDYDLLCHGSNATDINVSLEFTGIAERTISKICLQDNISLGRLNSAYEFLISLPYEKQLEVMDQIENQNLESFDDFRKLLDRAVIPSVTSKFYCPLAITLYTRDRYGDIDGNGYEEDGRFAARYEKLFRQKMREYNANDGENMAEYFYGSNSLCAKMRSVVWDFALRNDELYGCITVETAGELTTEQEQELKEWIKGQNSDGIGESFEQHEINIDGGYQLGEIYVSLWNSCDDYFIDNEDEFAKRLENQRMIGSM